LRIRFGTSGADSWPKGPESSFLLYFWYELKDETEGGEGAQRAVVSRILFVFLIKPFLYLVLNALAQGH
jgi:hypothetical protein